MPLLQTRGSGSALGYGLSLAASGPQPVLTNLSFYVDASIPASYPGSGTSWFDLSGNSRTAVLQGSASYSTLGGGAITFSGGYATVPTIARGTAFTIEVWFRAGGFPNRQYLYTQQRNPPTQAGFTYQDRQGTQLETNGAMVVQWLNTASGDNAAVTAAGSVGANTWYQYVVTVNNRVANFYFNGAFYSTTTASNDARTLTPNQAFIARRGDANGADQFSGQISIVRDYSRALTAAEVLQNFTASRIRHGL
jgi:hypothetical protein